MPIKINKNVMKKNVFNFDKFINLSTLVVEYMGRANAMSTWKLEHSTLKFLLKMTLNTTTYDRILPYSKEYFKPQPRFLR